MNKYDEKVLQVAPKNAVVYELLRKKTRGSKGEIINFLLEGLLSFGDAVKQLDTREAFYLVMNENNAELVTLQNDLTSANLDVTSSVQISSGKKHFLFDGYKYKLYRKIQ